ncbi:hypothetical protein ED733_001259 [Metarhizium rileyi]|uniref:FAD-binding FR-type domain-containing protein n=1 Tax=Metarhizium rileyi (strain RCEF 4871) TaxID=1649241 RepID=A0A5C6G5A0_METRR|nr:hypothetical protein ED733_001259 [Metarhizium rileyi]
MAGGSDDEAMMLMFAIRARKNEEATLAFIIALLSIGVAYIAFYLVRQSSHWVRRTADGKSALPPLLAAFPRMIRRASLQRAAGVPSLGHAAITTIYLGLNLVCVFANLDTNSNMTSNIASRTGWLAVANLVVVMFFALKNTPLAFLTAWSYERLNCLHRISGYVAVTHLVVHAACYSVFFYSIGLASQLLSTGDVYGIISGSCWVLLALAAVFIRRWWYELFYYLHVSLWVVSIVTLGLHQPKMANKFIYGTIIAGSMWGFDRIIRFVRLVAHSGNTATLTPLPNGGTRVTLANTPLGVTAGKHCFLWIPRLRLFETHPFTIASADPLEFVVASHNGFTADLHKHALDYPGVPLKASIEGPYGTVPKASSFETAILVSGGSGASFTFGLANTLLRRVRSSNTKRIIFVWIVKYNSYLKWFAHHLVALTKDTRFEVHVFVTRSQAPPVPPKPNPFVDHPQDQSRHYAVRTGGIEKKQIRVIRPMVSDSSLDLEKWQASSDNESIFSESSYSSLEDLSNLSIKYQKPNVASLIRDVVNATPREERVLISGCGPSQLMGLMRETTAECIEAGGPSIELHCEEFGW